MNVTEGRKREKDSLLSNLTTRSESEEVIGETMEPPHMLLLGLRLVRINNEPFNSCHRFDSIPGPILASGIIPIAR